MNNENISPKETNFGKHLKIILPDGKVIENRSSGKSLAELVNIIGPEKVKEAVYGLIVRKQKEGRSYIKLPGGYWLFVNTDTDTKRRQIEQIAEILRINVRVSIVRSVIPAEVSDDEITPDGKIQRITDPELLNTLAPYVKLRRNLKAILLAKEYYGSIGKMSMENWHALVTGANLQTENPQEEESADAAPNGKKPVEKIHAPKQMNIDHSKDKEVIKIIFPDGKPPICDRNMSKTFQSVIEYAGIDNVRSLDIRFAGKNIILPKEELNPTYIRLSAYKPLSNGMYLFTGLIREKKEEIIQEISKRLNLELKIGKAYVKYKTLG